MEDLEKRVLGKIDEMRDEIIHFHQEIIKMPSENPPGKYREISKFITTEMSKFGLDVIKKNNNVIGEVGEDESPQSQENYKAREAKPIQIRLNIVAWLTSLFFSCNQI